MESSEKRRNSAQKRRKAARARRTMLQVLIGLLILVLAVLFSFILLFKPVDPVVEKATLEAGAALRPDIFLTTAARNDGKTASITGAMANLDTKLPGTYKLELEVEGKPYRVTLVIEDRIAPTAEPVATATEVGVLPNAKNLVTNVQDATQVKITYRTEPDVSRGGETTAEVLLTDAGGNTAVITVKVLVTSDDVPPVIEGVKDVQLFVGDTFAYKAGVTVTDDQTAVPKLVVDNSQVNLNKVGTYTVTYTATDDAGNSTVATMTITVSEKPANWRDPEEVYALARDVLKDITKESMTDMERAFAIYRWVNTHIGYTGTSDKSSWTGAAYQAFTERAGDCYNYFAAAKALFDVAGIENIDVVKSDTSHSSHFWSLINLGGGWYHVDCTPRVGDGDNFFMNTDAELEAYSVKHKNSHIYDGSLYPERATESLQDKIDYKGGKIRK